MNVSLTPQMEEFIQQQVNSGKYSSPSEVIREALRLMGEYDRLRDMKLEALRRDIQEGLESLNKGEDEPLDIEAIKAEGRRQLAQMKRRRDR